MLVITGKRIKIILSCIFIAMFAFSFQIANQTETKNNDTDEVIQTTTTPVSGKTIVVDAGHGVPDEGAQSSTRNNRSRNKFKNSIEIAEFVRN